MANYEKIWLSPPHISDSEQKYVDEAFSQNWIAPAGPHLDRFEKEELEFFNNVRRAYLRLAEKNRDRYITIDAKNNEDRDANEIKEILIDRVI